MNNDEEIKCDYCNEIIQEEDSCEGSLYNGVKLCVDCLGDWQEDERCDCECCYERAVSNDIDCKIDDMRMSDDEYDMVYGE